jgi:hypothetical protein
MTREKANDLLERYLYKTGEELPKKQRDDVKAELRSLLTEAMEERAAEAGRDVDEEIAAQVLREFGKPDAVAERYRPVAYLIGPRLFPVFLDVSKIVLIVLACFYLGVVSLSLLTGSTRLPELFRPASMGGFFESFVKVALYNLAILTLVFALIERFGDTRPESSKEWDPRKLPAVPMKADPDRVSVADRVFKIYAIVALFIWVNEFPDTVGFWFFAGDQTRVVRFSDIGLHLPVLLLNIFWALALGLNMWLLKLGRWTRETRWAEFGLGLYGTLIFYMVLVSRLFLGPEGPATAEGMGLNPLAWLEAARADLPRWGRFLHGILTLFLLFSLIEAALRLFRIFRRYPLW